MKNEEEGWKVSAPLFLVVGSTECWKCGDATNVAALLAPHVEDTENEVCVFSEIERLPEKVLSYIRERVPHFKLTYSQTAGFEYFANTCSKCGSLIGDFYLHSKPGAPFFPNNEEEARGLKAVEIPIETTVRVDASLHVGSGHLILNNAKRSA